MNGLEALEIVKYECGFAFGQTGNGDRVRNSFPIIEKELKALEIIKKKVMKLVTLEDNTVWDNSRYEHIDLTQDEFDLLKEVLE